MTDETTPRTMDRRRFVQRSAAAGALAWAAPSVMTASRALANTGGSLICPAIIDPFTDDSSGSIAAGGTSPTSVNKTTNSANIRGGSRDETLTRTSGTFTVDYVVIGGFVSLEIGPNSRGNLALAYSFSGTDTDLTEGGQADRLAVEIDSIDGQVSVSIDLDGSVVTRNLTAADSGSIVYFPFAEFAGEDGTDVSSLTLTIRGNSDAADSLTGALSTCYVN